MNIDNEYDERYPLIGDGFNTYGASVGICYKIIQFLLDMPYEMKDGNLSIPAEKGCRAELIKYLFYDNANPLACALPTVKEKKALIFNPDKPQNPPLADKGYRIFAQSKVTDIQNDSRTELRIYPYMVVPRNAFSGDMMITFECWSNMDYKQLKDFGDRTYNMAICILRALCGRHIDGIGTMYFDKSSNSYCEIDTVLTDNRYNIGHRLVMGVSVADAHDSR